jgi:hypothetical protein
MTEFDARIEDAAHGRQDTPLGERQDTPRTLLRGLEGVMSWRVDERDVSSGITVLKISGGAASVRADAAPRVGQQIQLSLLSEPAKVEPIEGRVIETWSDPSGKCVVHLRFGRWVPLGAFFTSRSERRLWDRFPVHESRASLTWLEGETEKSIRGNLLNICVGGAAFIGDVLPPPGISIWLQLEARAHRGVGTGAIEGRLVMSSFDPGGRKVSHIEFVDPCPSDFFNLAIGAPG